jgi:transcriptional regulator with XRE-family HTH domain
MKSKHSLIEEPTILEMSYGKRLDKALTLALKERKELADAIGISVQAIGQVIQGKTAALTAENSAKAARFLKVDHYWLATGEGVPHPPVGATALSQHALALAKHFDRLEVDDKGVWATAYHDISQLISRAIEKIQPTETPDQGLETPPESRPLKKQTGKI